MHRPSEAACLSVPCLACSAYVGASEAGSARPAAVDPTLKRYGVARRRGRTEVPPQRHNGCIARSCSPRSRLERLRRRLSASRSASQRSRKPRDTVTAWIPCRADGTTSYRLPIHIRDATHGGTTTTHTIHRRAPRSIAAHAAGWAPWITPRRQRRGDRRPHRRRDESVRLRRGSCRVRSPRQCEQ